MAAVFIICLATVDVVGERLQSVAMLSVRRRLCVNFVTGQLPADVADVLQHCQVPLVSVLVIPFYCITLHVIS